MRMIGKVILIALGLFTAWSVYNALTVRKVGGRQAGRALSSRHAGLPRPVLPAAVLGLAGPEPREGDCG